MTLHYTNQAHQVESNQPIHTSLENDIKLLT